LFVRRDEVEAQWQWVDGSAAAWRAPACGRAPMPPAPGARTAAIALIERDGRSWND
jgi:glucose-6-phosphate 1-dehydrogenase